MDTPITVLDRFVDWFARKKRVIHMTASRTLSPFSSSLPDEIKMHIFSYLSVDDLVECCLVNREWSAMVCEDSLWRRFFVPVRPTSDPPLARVCHSAVTHNGTMYIYGGHIPDSKNFISDVKSDFYSYSFATRQWATVSYTTDVPLPLKTEHTAVVYNNCMYIFGGYSGNMGYRDTNIYEFNFTTSTWTRIEPRGEAPPERSAHTAVVYKDSMYIMGGWDGNESNRDMFSYNFVTREWAKVQATGEAPPSIRSHSAVVYKDSMVVFGGFGDTGHPQAIYVFNFLASRWEEVGAKPGPVGRSRFRSVLHDGSMWCFAGWDRTNYFNDLWRFDLDKRMWHQVPASENIPAGLGQHTMVVDNEIMYVFGGYNVDTRAPENTLFAYKLPHQNRCQAAS